MMTPSEELALLRNEASKLRKENASLARSRDAHRRQRDRLQNTVGTCRKHIKTLEGEKEELVREIEELKSRLNIEIDKAKTYAGMIFKTNVRKNPTTRGHRGAHIGHQGHGKAKPIEVDREVRVALTHCTCGTELARTDSCDTRIVEDIPTATTTVTRYEIERQWCTSCHEEVRGVPQGTIPGCAVGVNTLVYILTLKYRLRAPLAKISELLTRQYGLTLSEGGIQALLATVQDKFTAQYEAIKEEIRNAPTKHADETIWRIEGQNVWCWLFATQTAALYTIEETRGKDVPIQILGRDPTGVLVRDDYGGYKSLPMEQQSCWAHLLRVSHEKAVHERASDDMQSLHTELKTLFAELKTITDTPFAKRKRERQYAQYRTQIETITTREYTDTDVRAVQTRIRNQNTNLITALLHPGVSLTNNHGERMIRPMVVTRKISGGSQSDAGAKTHAVNMSIMQTLALKGTDFLTGITAILTAGNPRYAGKG